MKRNYDHLGIEGNPPPKNSNLNPHSAAGRTPSLNNLPLFVTNTLNSHQIPSTSPSPSPSPREAGDLSLADLAFAMEDEGQEGLFHVLKFSSKKDNPSKDKGRG